MYSKLIIKQRRSGVFIVNFKHILHLFLSSVFTNDFEYVTIFLLDWMQRGVLYYWYRTYGASFQASIGQQ